MLHENFVFASFIDTGAFNTICTLQSSPRRSGGSCRETQSTLFISMVCSHKTTHHTFAHGQIQCYCNLECGNVTDSCNFIILFQNDISTIKRRLNDLDSNVLSMLVQIWPMLCNLSFYKNRNAECWLMAILLTCLLVFVMH